MINAGMEEFAAAAARLPAPAQVTRGARGPRLCARNICLRLEPVPMPGPLNLSEVVAWLRGRLPRGRHPHQRCRQFLRLGAALLSVHRISHAARPDQWRDGLRRAGRDRGEARASGAHRGVLRRRWRLPDERPGARHRGAIRRGGDLRSGQQRHVRDDPHASGARVSGACLSAPRCAIPISRSLRARTGRFGCIVEKTADFAPAFEQALAAGVPAVLEVRIDPDAISTRASLTSIRERALQTKA